jgi:hypothetical protein
MTSVNSDQEGSEGSRSEAFKKDYMDAAAKVEPAIKELAGAKKAELVYKIISQMVDVHVEHRLALEELIEKRRDETEEEVQKLRVVVEDLRKRLEGCVEAKPVAALFPADPTRHDIGQTANPSSADTSEERAYLRIQWDYPTSFKINLDGTGCINSEDLAKLLVACDAFRASHNDMLPGEMLTYLTLQAKESLEAAITGLPGHGLDTSCKVYNALKYYQATFGLDLAVGLRNVPHIAMPTPLPEEPLNLYMLYIRRLATQIQQAYNRSNSKSRDADKPMVRPMVVNCLLSRVAKPLADAARVALGIVGDAVPAHLSFDMVLEGVIQQARLAAAANKLAGMLAGSVATPTAPRAPPPSQPPSRAAGQGAAKGPRAPTTPVAAEVSNAAAIGPPTRPPTAAGDRGASQPAAAGATRAAKGGGGCNNCGATSHAKSRCPKPCRFDERGTCRYGADCLLARTHKPK